MGFAIPISKAQDILNSLMTKKTRVAVSEDAQGYLGIQGTNIDAATSQMYGMPRQSQRPYNHTIKSKGNAMTTAFPFLTFCSVFRPDAAIPLFRGSGFSAS